MRKNFRLPPLVGGARAVLLAVAISGCRDGSVPTGHRSVTTQARSNALVATDSAWDTYDADVSVVTTRFDSAGRQLRRTPTPMAAHIQRALNATGRWSTVTTFSPRARQAIKSNALHFQPEKYEVGRIEDDGDGSLPRVYTDLGRQIVTKIPGGADARQNLPAALATGSGRAAPLPPLFDREWVRSTILPLSETESRRAKLVAKMGSPVRTENGLDQFTERKGNTVTVILVDPAISAPVDVSFSKDGRLEHHTNITYLQPGDGTAIRAQMTIATFAANLHGGHTVNSLSVANVHIGRRI